mmetsp:Transcript_21085/g.67192  ORF Transcript_21085/g.67192 Transcript_21085/m.67192 type:complete len:222 (+) Transcript_21085:1642-2307(+)
MGARPGGSLRAAPGRLLGIGAVGCCSKARLSPGRFRGRLSAAARRAAGTAAWASSLTSSAGKAAVVRVRDASRPAVRGVVEEGAVHELDVAAAAENGAAEGALAAAAAAAARSPPEEPVVSCSRAAKHRAMLEPEAASAGHGDRAAEGAMHPAVGEVEVAQAQRARDAPEARGRAAGRGASEPRAAAVDLHHRIGRHRRQQVRLGKRVAQPAPDGVGAASS